MTVPEVSALEGAALAAAGAYLLDVREEGEWTAGRTTHATWIRLGALEARVSEVPSDRQIICICRSGARSAKAARFLITSGRDAVNLTGGMRAWAESGLEIVNESGGTGTVI
jgi:rhodanese-related sulfurtransferase